MAVKIRVVSRDGKQSELASAASSCKRGVAGKAFDRRVREIAPEIIARQQEGCVTARQLEGSLHADGVLNVKGRRWQHRCLYRVLKRGLELGMDFILRSKSQAARERKPDYRSRAEKVAGREARFAKLLASSPGLKAQFDAVITSPILLLSGEGDGGAP